MYVSLELFLGIKRTRIFLDTITDLLFLQQFTVDLLNSLLCGLLSLKVDEAVTL